MVTTERADKQGRNWTIPADATRYDLIALGLDRYQRAASRTLVNPEKQDVTYFALEINDEAGEVAGKVKKLLRDNNGIMNDGIRSAIAGEIGDVLWPLSQLARVLGLSLGDIAVSNLEKLADRKARGVLGGSGDNR